MGPYSVEEGFRYNIVATRHDPRTYKGMCPEAVVHERSNQCRTRAEKYAQQWAKAGYWSSIYDTVTGECIIDYAPEGE